MNASPLPPDPSADEQAATWAARLDGGALTDRQRQELQIWLEADPEHRARLSAYCQLSADLEQSLPSLAAEGRLPGETPTAEALPPPSSRRRIAWAGIAAAVALSVVTWWVWPNADQVQNLATAAAQRETVTLSDGTRIELAAQTNLRIELTAGHRHVRLASGEAYFAVARDAARPFVVETPAGAVRVTGTAFAVGASPAGTLTVLVEEGSVQVHPGEAGHAPLRLAAGQRLRSDSRHHAVDTLSTEEVSAALAWREGHVVFAGTPLAEALDCFARHHGRGLAADADVAALTLGGRHRLDDLEGFLAALEAALPVQVNRGVNGVIRVQRRSSAPPAR